MNCLPSNRCRDETLVTQVCLALKPGQCSKIRAAKTVTTTSIGCTRTVTYVALDAQYNPLTGYTDSDEVECGNGEHMPFACGTSTVGPTPASDREVITLCNGAGDPVLVQYDVTAVPPTESSRWNLITNAAEPAGPLSQCDAAGVEVLLVRGCLNGQPINGMQVIADNASPVPNVLGSLWQDPITGAWGTPPVGMTFGECLPAQCEPATPVGVISTWGV